MSDKWIRIVSFFVESGGASSLRNRFENMAKANEEEAQRRKDEEKLRRETKDKADKERVRMSAL